LRRGGIALGARIENVLDKHYEDVLGFATPGRTILVGVRAASLLVGR